MERRFRNPKSRLLELVPKDGVRASTLEIVGGLWVGWVPILFIPGILLVDLPLKTPVLKALGFILIGMAGTAWLIGMRRLHGASRARKAWRRQHA